MFENLVTLDSSYYTFITLEGYIQPAADSIDSLLWESHDDSTINIDNGQCYKIRSVESNLIGGVHVVKPHESLASFGIVIAKIDDFDVDGRYYFGIINTNLQSISLSVNDPIAYIVYQSLI